MLAERNLKRFVYFMLYALAVALSIKSLREPDLWWQIRTGEWILEHGKVPHSDVFSYTREGVQWINIKWGAEVVAALISRISGPESIVIIQALISALIVFFLLKWSRTFSDAAGRNPLVLLVFIPALAGVEYRMTGRPEMYSHLLAIVFCYLYYRHYRKGDKLIWLIVPLQLFWANFHEAFGLGFVISFVFVVASFVHDAWHKEPYKKSLQLLTIALVSGLIIVINPNGIDLLLRPLNIYSQLESNKYTSELFSISSYQYWKREAWIALLLLLFIGAYILFLIKNRGLKVLEALKEKEILSFCLLVILFVYLAATAYRNIVFLTLILTPAAIYILDFFFAKISQKYTLKTNYLWLASAVLLMVSYITVVSNKWYEITDSRDSFGMEVLSVNNPVGAAEYVVQHKIKRQRIFSDYLTSSYLLWKLQPDFKTFIDLRDLDVFSDTSFQEFAMAVQIPEYFEQQDSLYKFDAVVLFRPEFSTLHRYLYESKKWRLAFADAVATVYEPDTTARNATFSSCYPVSNSKLSAVVNKILNPLYSSYDYHSFSNNKIAATYFLIVRDFERAKFYAGKAIAASEEADASYTVMGDIYYNEALAAVSVQERETLLQQAFDNYQKAVSVNKCFVLARLGLGAVYFQNRNFRAAAEQFDEGVKCGSDELNLYLFAAQAYSMLMSTDASANEKVLQYFKKANRLNPDNPVILLNIAAAAYRSGDCSEALSYAVRVKDVAEFSAEEKNTIATIIQKCGN